MPKIESAESKNYSRDTSGFNKISEFQSFNENDDEEFQYADIEKSENKKLGKSMKSNRSGGQNKSIRESDIGISFVASNKSVFISWHDINFTVPVISQGNNTIKGGDQQLFMDPDDPRVTLLYSHNKEIRASNDGSSIKSGPGKDIN